MNKGISKEESNKFINVLEEIQDNQFVLDFVNPVDFVGLGLDDYPKIIKTPMDISTVKRKLVNSKYHSLKEVFDDIQLIWDNCRTYNADGSVIYKLANKCEKLANKLLEKTFKIGIGSKKDKKKAQTQTQIQTEILSAVPEKKDKKKTSKSNKKQNIQDNDKEDSISEHGAINLKEKEKFENNQNLLIENKNIMEKPKALSGILPQDSISESKQKNHQEIPKFKGKRLNERLRGINTLPRGEKEIEKKIVDEVEEEEVEDENQDLDQDESNPNKLSLMEKISLSDRVKLLANDGLASLVRLVQKECPASIDDVDEDNLQIKLNKLEKKTYEQINQLINTFLKVKETNQENLGAKRGRNEK